MGKKKKFDSCTHIQITNESLDLSTVTLNKFSIR